MTSPADAEEPPVIADTSPDWFADINEWLSYQWKRLHQHEAVSWPPPWGPSAAAIVGMALIVLLFGGVLIPLVKGVAGFVTQGAEWVRSTAAADIVLQPVRRYLDAHAAGLPVNANTLWWTWCATGIVLFSASALGRTLTARLGWVLFGMASTVMVYNAAAAPAQPVAAGATVLWWIGFSTLALRRTRPSYGSVRRRRSGDDQVSSGQY